MRLLISEYERMNSIERSAAFTYAGDAPQSRLDPSLPILVQPLMDGPFPHGDRTMIVRGFRSSLAGLMFTCGLMVTLGRAEAVTLARNDDPAARDRAVEKLETLPLSFI